MGFVLDIFVEYLARQLVRLVRSWNARSWKIVKARITRSAYRAGGLGCAVADVAYTYEVNGRAYSAKNSVPFIFDMSARDYVAHYSPNTDLLTRVKPNDPNVSVVRENDMYRLNVGLQLEIK
jgi:hypothetical protein